MVISISKENKNKDWTGRKNNQRKGCDKVAADRHPPVPGSLIPLSQRRKPSVLAISPPNVTISNLLQTHLRLVFFE